MTGTRNESLVHILHRFRNSELAQAIGISKRTAIRWRVGEAVPASRYLRRLAQYLNLTDAELNEIIERDANAE